MVNELTPDRDSSLGLIFRLNKLWASVDFFSTNGRYDEWNNVLDALYRNLHYRNDMETIVDKETGKILDVKLSKKDIQEYKHLSMNVAKRRKEFLMNRNPRLKKQKRSRWYHAVQKKDIYTRKFMQSLKLYLKETEKRPGTAMFGTLKRR